MRRFLWLWLGLLVLSNGWRLTQSETLPLDNGQLAVELPERDGDRQTGERIIVAVRQFGDPENPAVLVLHGTPMPSPAMRRLARELEDDFFVVVPDLPGFGRSTLDLPDYSSITHGHYASDLMQVLGMDEAHVIGYSQGGAPAIVLAANYPERTRSVTLLAAIGVQELELFGSYTVNHAVYAGQLALLRACEWLIPHFGLLDGAILGNGYARNLTDTDQRILREQLQRIAAPTLIVHGEHDGLVPVEAAREHRRLVAQSKLVELPAGHEIGYSTPQLATPAIREFYAAVAAGSALTLADAEPDRIAQSRTPFVAPDRAPLSGFALVVLLLAIVVAAYVSEDLTCIAAGFLVAQGILSLPLAIAACLVGLFTSDVALFLVGRWFGAPAVRRLISEAAMQRATDWLTRRGPLVIIISRFTPGTRLPTYLMAGALHMPAALFIGYFALATAIWTPLLVTLAATYGTVAEQWFGQYAASALWYLVIGALLLWLAVRFLPSLATWRGRRLALGQWRRFRHFEYWPRWAYYAPIVLFNIGQALRHRSLTAFTLVNPAIPLGGLTGESKTAILKALEPSGNVASFVTLDVTDTDTATGTLRTFVGGAGHGYPVVLKPDCGERGRDVLVVRDERSALEYLAEATGPVIAQRLATGEEYGVLYCREPGDETGTITSVARKADTVVIGDGRSTLERLVLADDRAVNMAPFFLSAHADHLQSVPAAGETVRLNSIGTHSRGSIFLDRQTLATDALRAALDRIADHFEGFHLGRFDLFAPNEQALSSGVGLVIVELNGLTSEPAHIYQPGARWRDAMIATCAHWAAAWRIGVELKRQGHSAPGPIRLIRELRHLMRRSRHAEL